MMEYFYRIYGLRVQSQIPFSEAVPETAGEAEVKIGFGRMPDFLLEAGQKGYGTWTNGFVSAWFRIRDGTQVYVEGGSRITVELSEEPQLLVITSLLLSAGMALVCLQRGEPFFHGSALYTGEQAILLCGESGAGKSTVAMELLQRKLGFLADDTVRVHPGTMGMLAEPSYPQQKLCRDMALKCGKPLEELIYIDEERDKYAWRRQGLLSERGGAPREDFFAAKGCCGRVAGCGAEYRGRGSEYPKAHRAESTGDFEQPVVSGGYLPVQYRDSVSFDGTVGPDRRAGRNL